MAHITIDTDEFFVVQDFVQGIAKALERPPFQENDRACAYLTGVLDALLIVGTKPQEISSNLEKFVIERLQEAEGISFVRVHQN